MLRRLLTRRARSLALASAALAVSVACGDSPEPTASTAQALAGVVFKWSSVTSQPLHSIAPRNDGSALAVTKRDVIAFGPTGLKTVVFAGSLANGRPVVQEGVDGFAVPVSNQFGLYDKNGVNVANIPRSVHQYLRLVPGSLQTFVPAIESLGSESGVVTHATISSPSGKLQAQFPAADLVRSRTTASHLLWATDHSLTKSTLAGKLVWSTPIRVQKFETNASARFSIVNRAGDTRVVELYDEKTKIGSSTFGKPVWNLAIAPAGQWAAANDTFFARLFLNGALHRNIPTGTTMYPVSIDVSDLGYVLVGLQNHAAGNVSVRLYGPSGVLAWSKTLPNDTQAFRPDVRFTPNGLGFFVREKTTLSFYGLVNP